MANLLSNFTEKFNDIEIILNDKTYKLTTKIKFLKKIEDNYSKYISNGKRVTFLKILKDNIAYIFDYQSMMAKGKYSKQDVAIAIANEALDNIDIYAITIIIYSMIDDENLTFEEFQEFDMLEFINVNFSKIIENVYEDVVKVSDDSDKNKKK